MSRPHESLSPAALEELGQPFTLEAVKFKPLTKPGRDGKAAASFYIDARLAAERLNFVVGPHGWSDDYEWVVGPAGKAVDLPALGFPVMCRLTVLGVTKTDVGQISPGNVDDKAFKSALSDALKRAAVKFRVGAYLYAIPRLRAQYDEGSKGFSEQGKKYLATAYSRWLANLNVNRFGEPLDHGDVVLADLDADESIPFMPEKEVAQV